MNNKIKIIKIEVIFKKFENFFYWLMDSRYRFYRLGGLFLAVAVLGGGFFIWQMFFGSDQAKADWYLSSWTRRLKITINADQVTSDLTNFPLLVATSTIDLATYAKSDGSDIVFVDGKGVKLAYEIEKYTATTGELVAWVKVPTVSSVNNTDIYMYYGYSGGQDQSSPSDVWNENFGGVWHLASGNVATKDSTVNANQGTAVNNPTASSTSAIGDGMYFNGDAQYVSVANSTSLNVDNITMETWFKSSTSTTNLFLMSKDP